LNVECRIPNELVRGGSGEHLVQIVDWLVRRRLWYWMPMMMRPVCVLPRHRAPVHSASDAVLLTSATSLEDPEERVHHSATSEHDRARPDEVLVERRVVGRYASFQHCVEQRFRHTFRSKDEQLDEEAVTPVLQKPAEFERILRRASTECGEHLRWGELIGFIWSIGREVEADRSRGGERAAA